MQNEMEKKNTIKVWLQACRPFSFTASITPILIGAALAAYYPKMTLWFLFPVLLVCSLLIHAATNLISDYEDHKRGVDTDDYNYGSSGVLVSKLLTPQQVKKGAYLVFALAFLLGLIVVAFRGFPILLLGLFGMAGGYFYTVSPVGYKYYGLGDFFVFLFMGVLLVVGSFLALTGFVDREVILISFPISLLVTAILHANNVRDIEHDQEVGIATFASKIGHRLGQVHYHVLLIAAYVVTLALILTKVVSAWSLLVFLSVPIALKNMKTMRASQSEQPESIATLDADTAKLHLLFGILFVISLVIGSIAA